MLAALYFVPSATASPDQSASAQSATTQRAAAASQPNQVSQVSQADQTSQSSQSAQNLGLADTGAIDTKPYVVGGAAFLVAGAGLVLNAGRRSRQAAAGPQSAV